MTPVTNSLWTIYYGYIRKFIQSLLHGLSQGYSLTPPDNSTNY